MHPLARVIGFLHMMIRFSFYFTLLTNANFQLLPLPSPLLIHKMLIRPFSFSLEELVAFHA